MRVITGSAKGKKLKSPKGSRIRPTTDRIKEALFSIIGNRIKDSVFLDCFAGTGNIGIEALSRGAKKCYFIESHFESIRLIKENLNYTNLSGKAVIIPKNVVAGMKELSNYDEKIDIIFLDPPYLKDYIKPSLESIVLNDLVHTEGFVIIEHSKKEDPITQEGLVRYREQIYGNTVLSFYSKEEK